MPVKKRVSGHRHTHRLPMVYIQEREREGEENEVGGTVGIHLEKLSSNFDVSQVQNLVYYTCAWSAVPERERERGIEGA